MKEYIAGRMNYPGLPEHLKIQLEKIQPSSGVAHNARPCAVVLNDKIFLDAVYIVNAQDYIDIWGVWPKDDKAKREIDIASVLEIKESTNRLPPKFAEVLYRAGESAMGGCVFTIYFEDNTKQPYQTGNAVDFIELPDGKTMNDIIDVHPHEGRGSDNYLGCLDYFWCLFDPGER